MNQHNDKSGFTLIELMLSMSFIGMLLVAIAATSMNIMQTYTKGVTIREVNQVGRVVSEDLERTISSSPRFKVNPAKTGEPSDPPGSSDSKYVVKDGGGRLCTGSFTYAWNYGKTKELTGDASLPPIYNVYSDNSEFIRFVKVSDSGGMLCRSPGTAITKSSARELLAAGDRNLAVQELTVIEGARDEVTGQAIYAISLRLGTNDRTQLNATGTSCLPPTQGSGNEDFCAINQFDIVTRAGNRSGSI